MVRPGVPAAEIRPPSSPLILRLLLILLLTAGVRPLPQQLNQQQRYKRLNQQYQRQHAQQDYQNGSCSLRQLCPYQRCLHGICIDTGNGGECFCEDGYTGLYCETDADDCLSAPCLHGGTCSDLVRGYSCDCPPGYTGDSCQSLVRGCEEARCLNGASCVYAHHGLVACLCPPGFRGLHCERDISVCRHVTPPHVRCHNGGYCLDGPANTYHCQCQPGYTGATCRVDVNECASSPCQNGGSCIDQVNDFQCVCQPGFSGRLCQSALRNCEVNVCENGGLCVLTETGAACLCRPDFHGDRCQRRYDDCQPTPKCLHGGSCVDEVSSFRCECPPEASGHYCQCLSSKNGTYCVAPEHTRPRVAGLHPHLVVTVGYSTVFHTSVVATEFVEATASVAYDATTESVTAESTMGDASEGAVTGSGIMPSFETVEPGEAAASTPPPVFSPSAGGELRPSASMTLPASSGVDWDILSSPREPKDLPQTPSVSGEDAPLQTVPNTELTSPTLPLPVMTSPSIVITSPGVVPSPPSPSEVTPTSPSPSPVASSDLLSTSLVVPPEDQAVPFTESSSATEKTTMDITTLDEDDDMITTSHEEVPTPDAGVYTQTEEVSTQIGDLTTETDELPIQTEVVYNQTEVSTEAEDTSPQAAEEVTTTAGEVSTQATGSSAQTADMPTQAEEVSTRADEMATQAEEVSTQAEPVSTQAEQVSTQADKISTQAEEASTQETSLPPHDTTEEASSTPFTTSEEPFSPSEFTTGGTSAAAEPITEETMTRTDATTAESPFPLDVSTGEGSTTPHSDTEEPSTTGYSTAKAIEITSELSTGASSTPTDVVTEEVSVTLEYATTDSHTTPAFTTEASSRSTDMATEEISSATSDFTTAAASSTIGLTTPSIITSGTSVTSSSSTEETTGLPDFVTEVPSVTSNFTPGDVSMTSDFSTEYTSIGTESTAEGASTLLDLATEETEMTFSTYDSTTEVPSTPTVTADITASITADITTTDTSVAPTSPFSSDTTGSASVTEEPLSTASEPDLMSTTGTSTAAKAERETTEIAPPLPDGTIEVTPSSPSTLTSEVTLPSTTGTTSEVAPPSSDAPTTEMAPPSPDEVTSDLLPIRFFPETYLLLESEGDEGPPEDPEDYKDGDLLEEVLSDEGQFLEDGMRTDRPTEDAQKEEERQDVQPEQDKQKEGGGDQTNSFTEDAKRVTIKISFATLSEDGVVLSSLPAGVPPWYRLFLSGGLLRLAFACSGLQATSFIETQAKVNTGRRVTVHFVLRWLPGPSSRATGSCRAAMRVAGSPVTVAQQFADRPLDRRVALVVGSPPAEPGFSGYLLQLQVNGRRFDELSLIVADSVGASRSPCDEAGCQHGSTCRQVTWMEVSCLCRPGFSGARCEVAPCDPAPCGPGGQCALLATGAPVCLCPFGRSGHYCQEEATFVGSRYRFHGSAGGLSSYLALNVSGNLRHQFWMFFHLSTNETRQTSLLALLTDAIPKRSSTRMDRTNTTVVLDEFSDKNPAAKADSAAFRSSKTSTNSNPTEDVLEPARPWRSVQSDFFAVTLSHGYVTVTWHLGSGSKRLMSEAPLDPEMTVQTVRVGRRDQRVWLQVNAQRVVTARAPGDYTKLDVANVLYVGGYSGAQHSSELPADLSSYPGYVGCVFDLRLGLGSYRGVPLTVWRGRHVTPCRLDHCQRLSGCPAPPPARPSRVSRRSP